MLEDLAGFNLAHDGTSAELQAITFLPGRGTVDREAPLSCLEATPLRTRLVRASFKRACASPSAEPMPQPAASGRAQIALSARSPPPLGCEVRQPPVRLCRALHGDCHRRKRCRHVQRQAIFHPSRADDLDTPIDDITNVKRNLIVRRCVRFQRNLRGGRLFVHFDPRFRDDRRYGRG
jgi:hypothetical protein